jgi:hypothetical protein
MAEKLRDFGKTEEPPKKQNNNGSESSKPKPKKDK